MHFLRNHARQGSSLIEFVLFVAIFSIAAGAVVVLLFNTGEQRKRQEGIALVDQTGVQLLQTLARRIRAAEVILDPSRGSSGSILALQMAALEDDPTILTVQSGAIMVAEYDSIFSLTNSGELLVSDFVVRNTSPSDDRPSVYYSFIITKTLGIPSQPTYSRMFEELVTLFPDDQHQGNACGCTAPTCSAGKIQWQYCVVETCTNGPVSLQCE